MDSRTAQGEEGGSRDVSLAGHTYHTSYVEKDVFLDFC